MGKMCQDHWDKLLEAIKHRGMEALIAEDGETAATKMRRMLEEDITIDSFEPLLYASNNLLINSMKTIEEGGGNPMYLLMEGPEDPMVEFNLPYATWSRCAICYLSQAHEATCKGCDLPTKDGYGFWVEKAADGALEKWQELKII